MDEYVWPRTVLAHISQIRMHYIIRLAAGTLHSFVHVFSQAQLEMRLGSIFEVKGHSSIPFHCFQVALKAIPKYTVHVHVPG